MLLKYNLSVDYTQQRKRANLLTIKYAITLLLFRKAIYAYSLLETPVFALVVDEG
jgi:hypothetical protein